MLGPKLDGMTTTGRLVVVCVPIGNTADASPRLHEALREADVIAAEDTRRTKRLITDLNITTSARLVPYHDHNESSKAQDLIERATEGATIAVVSDAGMPGISDPGYRIIQQAIAAQIPITCVPGPSAVPTALILSGLPSDRFCFEGFVARKEGERTHQFETLANEPRTMVFFDSPRRLAATLLSAATIFGPDRQAAICRELTKTFEEVVRGTLTELQDWVASKDAVLGEISIVIAGRPKNQSQASDLVHEVRTLVDGGMRLKDATKHVAKTHDVRHRELYDAAVRSQKADDTQV